MIPPEINRNFDYAHIKLVWQELHDRFGFNVEGWKEKFQEDLQKQKREVSELYYFFTFCNNHINPILNDILCRKRVHPTFNNLVKYILTKYEKAPTRR